MASAQGHHADGVDERSSLLATDFARYLTVAAASCGGVSWTDWESIEGEDRPLFAAVAGQVIRQVARVRHEAGFVDVAPDEELEQGGPAVMAQAGGDAVCAILARMD